jgi:hypothetical protein
MVVFTGSHTLHGHQKKMSGSMVILADRMGDGRTFAVALMCALVAGCRPRAVPLLPCFPLVPMLQRGNVSLAYGPEFPIRSFFSAYDFESFFVDVFPWSDGNYFHDFFRSNNSVNNSVSFYTITSQAVQFFF